MARENSTAESNRLGVAMDEPLDADCTDNTSRIDITCPRCESRWTCGERADPTCPDCETSFSVRVRDEFALVERAGWTVAVAVAGSDRPGAFDG